MALSSADLKNLLEDAKTAAYKAGRLISEFADKNIEVFTKPGGSSKASQVLTEVDIRCQNLILEQLNRSIEQYDLAILSEELEDDQQRLIKQAFWCIDPLDGTLAFTKSQPGYSVSIALVSKDGKPLIGVVYDPVSDTLYTAIRGMGAYKNDIPWQPLLDPLGNKLTVPCDRSLLEREEYSTIRQALDNWVANHQLDSVNERFNAGAVINACTTLENPPAVYFKPPKAQEGGGSLWDFAATACIYHEVGAFVSDYDENDLDLNRAETTFMNRYGVIFSTDQSLLSYIAKLK